MKNSWPYRGRDAVGGVAWRAVWRGQEEGEPHSVVDLFRHKQTETRDRFLEGRAETCVIHRPARS